MKATQALTALVIAAGWMSLTSTSGLEAAYTPPRAPSGAGDPVMTDHRAYLDALRRAEDSIVLVTAENARLRKRLRSLESGQMTSAPDLAVQPAGTLFRRLRLDESLQAQGS